MTVHKGVISHTALPQPRANMAARAGGNLPSHLALPNNLDGDAEPSPGSMRKRKRAAGGDELAPCQGTGQ